MLPRYLQKYHMSQRCRVQAVATFISISRCVAGERTLGDFFSRSFFFFLFFCACLFDCSNSNFPSLWFSLTELPKQLQKKVDAGENGCGGAGFAPAACRRWGQGTTPACPLVPPPSFPTGKPAARRARRDSAPAVQTALRQKGKWIDLGGNTAGRPLRGQDPTPTPSPALRGAGKNCVVCKRLPKVLCQSWQPKLTLKFCLPRNTGVLPANGTLLPPISKINPSKLLFTHDFGSSLASWPNTFQGAQSSAEQQLTLQLRSPGVKTSKGPARSLPCVKQISSSSILICSCTLAMPTPSTRL